MNGLMIFTNNFEDVEAIAVVDILKRASIDITLASLHENSVKSAHDLIVNIDTKLQDIDYTKYDFLIIPGGPAVYGELHHDKLVETIIDYFVNSNKLVCAICAAPSLIGKKGYFKDGMFTCFPGCYDNVKEGTYSKEPVVVSKNFILARSMYYACDFALEIVKHIKGNEIKEKIEKSIKGL